MLQTADIVSMLFVMLSEAVHVIASWLRPGWFSQEVAEQLAKPNASKSIHKLIG
jgi:hypothetical protein